VLGVAWRADGRLLATSGADNVVKVWEAATGNQMKTISGFNKEVTAIRYLGTEDRIVFGVGDGQVASRNSNGDGRPGFPGGSGFVHCVRCSEDGQIIVAGGQDGVVRVWNQEGKPLMEFAPNP
jgi:WD40 repeat protein